ncbi:TerC family protein [Marinoscillum furvescens]|uniref:Putative tellurium resistance membrane protein TerC n=1 Tax=Marinoscillum furvescens DSM 4134 TaxID=1122208 RepID=A0A3D9L670_MARFU|nr:TerC family protein [Marinoscillum furvescens]REE01670.1 putative tellurium resistance membrane protein TerC [Marinoscillum furvescens DSM 4134]
MEIFLEPATWIALLTLTFLEIVLGIDNIIFISIVTNKLPQAQQGKARNLGLALALIFRVGLLLGVTWIITFTEPLFTVFELEISGRDLVLLGGGLFLLFKSTMEIHHKMEGPEHHESDTKVKSFTSVIIQIILLDVIFSFDSILTAIGLTEEIILMVIAVVVSIGIMMVFSKSISDFISKHPTLEVLALSFLILIGFMLMVEALHQHVPKGYIYFAVFFSLVVELLNMRMRKKRSPVKLRKRITE